MYVHVHAFKHAPSHIVYLKICKQSIRQSDIQKLKRWLNYGCLSGNCGEIPQWGSVFHFGLSTLPKLHSAVLREVPLSVSKLMKNLFIDNMFKIAKVFKLMLSASLLFSACSSNLRRKEVYFDSIWMRRGLSGCDILDYKCCSTRLHGRAIWVCCIGLW